MKRLFLASLLIIAVISCKKMEFAPEGPTDVRIRNLSTGTFTDLKVKIKDEEIIFGKIDSLGVSDYHRFKTAFPKAEISATINGIQYSTGSVDYTYMNYFGQVRLTYELKFENNALEIFNVVLDSHLELK
jgi:hypothetical protein